MKGIIFNLFEQVVTCEHGEAFWESLLDDTGLDGSYTSVGSYPDAELGDLLGAAAKRLDVPAGELLRGFGRRAFPRLAAKYPALIETHGSAASLLRALNSVIHPEVRKLYPDADVPEFAYPSCPEGEVHLRYSSERKLCGLAEGFVEGAADHFGEAVEILHPECLLRADESCLLVCRFGVRD